MSSVPVALIDAGNAGIFMATSAVANSALQWTFTSPWWKDPLGGTVILKDMCMLVILVPSCLLLVWPGLIGPVAAEVLLLCSMVGISVVLTWRSVVLYRIKRPWPLPPRTPRADKDS